jgi:MFS family permease
MIAVLVLHAGPGEVAALSATGTAVGALLAVPLGPWVEDRRKRPVMVAMDLIRFGVLATVPVAYALGRLGFVQLLLASVVVGAAEITFRAASGAAMKALVAPEHLLIANSRFESTTWTATVLGPPLGGAAVGLLGPVATIVADAVSYLLSALGIRAIGADEAPPAGAARGAADPAAGDARERVRELLAGWRFILADPELRPFFFNGVLTNGLLMVTEPLLSVLMLGRLGFAPWEFGLAFAVPCIGGLIGSRIARRIAARYGERRIMLVSGVARSCWVIGLVALGPGVGGLLLVMAVELGLIFCCGVYNPLFATHRLRLTPDDRIARVLSAWSVTNKLSIAALTALWGGLAEVVGPGAAIGLAGALMLATPLLLPLGRRGRGRGRGLGRQAAGAEAELTPAQR